MIMCSSEYPWKNLILYIKNSILRARRTAHYGYTRPNIFRMAFISQISRRQPVLLSSRPGTHSSRSVDIRNILPSACQRPWQSRITEDSQHLYSQSHQRNGHPSLRPQPPKRLVTPPSECSRASCIK